MEIPDELLDAIADRIAARLAPKVQENIDRERCLGSACQDARRALQPAEGLRLLILRVDTPTLSTMVRRLAYLLSICTSPCPLAIPASSPSMNMKGTRSGSRKR